MERHKALHVYAGPPRGFDSPLGPGFGALLEQRQADTREVDHMRDEEGGSHNVLNDDVLAELCRECSEGSYMGALLGTPCDSFCCARWEPLPRRQEGSQAASESESYHGSAGTR